MTGLTVAYPHGVLALCSIDSNISLPTSRKYGSCVARYRYMALSINSVEQIDDNS